MNIEISERQYWKKMNYYDGLLYCQLLNIDGKDRWRMIHVDEKTDEILLELYGINDVEEFAIDSHPIWYGDLNYSSWYENETFWVIPVRYTIEIASDKYWKYTNYYDALLYCAFFNVDDKNDWRLPIDMEEIGIADSWCGEDSELFDESYLTGTVYMVIPVRDI
jgi:hypothetical protein